MAELKIKADSGGGTVGLKGPATTTGNAAVQLTLPVDDGTANQTLTTNGSGVLSWAAPVIADDSIVEAKLDVSNAPTNGQFLQAQSGEGGGLTWAAAGGEVVDWKYVIKTDVFSEASVANGGVSGAAISITYTAASTSNRLLITAMLMINTSSNPRHGVIAYKDGSAFARGDEHPDDDDNLARMSSSGYNSGQSYTMDSMPFQFIDTPADTSSHTYDFRIWNGKNGTNTVYLNRTSTSDDYARNQGTGMSSISILELGPQQS